MWHVYHLVDPRTGQPFYVGISIAPKRRCAAHHTEATSAAMRRCTEITKEGMDVGIEVLASFDNKDDALAYESDRIHHGIALHNRTHNKTRCPVCSVGRKKWVRPVRRAAAVPPDMLTPEMIAVGNAVFASYRPRVERPEDLVQRIYLEMILAKPVRRRGVRG